MEELRKYKIAALIGIIIMGIGAFMACLCTASYKKEKNLFYIFGLLGG